MFCTKCGNKINEEEKFCSVCGKQIDEPVNKLGDSVLKLKQDIFVALPIYKELSIYSEKIEHATQKRNEANTLLGQAKSAIRVWILAFIGYAILYIATEGEGTTIGTIIGIFILSILEKRKKNRLEMEIDEWTNKAEEYMKKVNCPELYILPEKYRYYIAANYIYECLDTGRASTLKEALNLYEEQVHRWEMESTQNYMIKQLNTQQMLLGLLLLKR